MSSDSKLIKKATLEVLSVARELVGGTVKDKWESPRDGRKTWRKRLPGGKYEYSDTPPQQKKPSKDTGEKKVVKYKKVVHLSSKQLKDTLDRGFFSIISAGRNPNNIQENKMMPNSRFFHKRHEALRVDLEKAGFKYTEVAGCYQGSREPSFMVFHDNTKMTPKTSKSMMVHHRDAEDAKRNRRRLSRLATKYNQDSIVHGLGGTNQLEFTTGKKKGKTCEDKGWKENPEKSGFYTDIKLDDTNHTNFTLNLDDCEKKGLM